MVEFGLKLENNKVAEWRGNYIDYDKLKDLIKKAGKASKFRKDLEKRNPEDAALVKTEYEAVVAKREVKSTNASPSTRSDVSLNQVAFLPVTNELPDGLEQRSEETIQLLSKGSGKSTPTCEYGSQDAPTRPIPRVVSDNSLAQMISGVTGIFHRTSYNSKLMEALRTEDIWVQSFAQCIYEELEKVNSFYNNKLDELQKRLDLLVENVGQSYNGQVKRNRQNSLMSFSVSVKRRVSMITPRLKKSLYQSIIQNSISKRKLTYEDSDDELESELVEEVDQEYLDKIRESDSVKRALIELHRVTKLLCNYVILNNTGFVKIIKKFQKSFPKKDTFNDISGENICQHGKAANSMADRMEVLFANWFCDGQVTVAQSKMLPKKGDGLQMDWSQLRLGYRLGMCSILAIWVCWDCVWGLLVEEISTIGGRTAFPVFRACGGLLLLHWCWGLSAYTWNRYRINYIYLFDFNPRIVDNPLTIFEDATDETLVYFMLMLLYYKSGANEIPAVLPPGGYPFILVLYTIKCLIFPWRTRAPMWKAILCVLTAPLIPPTFYHVYVADVFTSMVKVFQDILWTACFILSGDFLIESQEDVGEYKLWQKSFWYKNVVIPLICLFPLWIRFNQCLRRYTQTGKRCPNLANAFKYAMSQTVTLFGAFHPLYLLHSHSNHAIKTDEESKGSFINSTGGIDLFQIFWMGLFVSSSLYSFSWDVYMDWGLGRPKFGFLGPRLMFPHKMYYYGVMCADLFLRFMWVLTLIPPQSGARFEIPNYLTAVTMSLELLRRTMWGFFRLEHEHRHNSEGFRRVGFVPLHFSTGHTHKYDRKNERVGWTVLGEVALVTAIVVSISICSVVSAQKATRFSNNLGNQLEF